MKKLIATTLAAVMAAALLAGCSAKPAAPAATQAPAATAAPETTAAPAATTAAAAETTAAPAETQAASGELTRPASYPARPITMIVPYAAGGAADVIARALAQVLPDYLDGVTVNCENVTGGNGVVGVTQLKGAKADGYTIGVYASPVFEITPSMNDVEYTLDDFTFLGTDVQRPNVLAVNAKSEWKTLEDFVNYVKANPGKATYGDPAAGSAHLGYESFIKAAGLEMTFVPYSGGTGEAITALLGGHVDSITGLPADTYEYYRSGDLRLLAVEGESRLDTLPDVPTMKECGYDIVIGLTNGVIAPAGLDPEIAAYLEQAVEKAVNDPRVLEADPGDAGLLVYYNGAETKQLLAGTAETFKGIIEELGLSK